jgi:hypothetical protein
MSFAAVYFKLDGHLYSSGTSVADNLDPALAVKWFDSAPPSGASWDQVNLVWLAPQPSSAVLTPAQFYKRFTPAEAAQVYASSDVNVAYLTRRLSLAQDVDLADPDVVSGVNYLASVGLIGADRAAAILNP